MNPQLAIKAEAARRAAANEAAVLKRRPAPDYSLSRPPLPPMERPGWRPSLASVCLAVVTWGTVAAVLAIVYFAFRS